MAHDLLASTPDRRPCVAPSLGAIVVALACGCARPSASTDASAARPPTAATSVAADKPAQDVATREAGASAPTFAVTVDDPTLDGAADCKVFVTAVQSRSKVSWHGPCKNGFADGLGVVRYAAEGNVDAHFYGALNDGYWDSGAYVEGGGSIAGRFKDNARIEVLDDSGVDDRNVTSRAFDTAAKAATQLSRALETQKKSAPAKTYKAAAEQLSRALD